LPVEPPPGLPCPVPLLFPAAGEPPPPEEDEPPPPDPVLEEFDPPFPGTEAPPLLDVFAEGWWWVGGFPPVAVGGALEYWTSLESA